MKAKTFLLAMVVTLFLTSGCHLHLHLNLGGGKKSDQTVVEITDHSIPETIVEIEDDG
jgi:hypothetical protein